MHNINDEKEALILCGGLGTRFKEVDENIPKSLAIVSGQPIIKWLISDLINQNFKRIILATGHMSFLLQQYVQEEFGDMIIFSNENKPLGTGGAIKNAQHFFKSESFLVINGDSRIIYEFDRLYNFHKQNKADASILLSSKISGTDYGNIEISKNNQITKFLEKKSMAGIKITSSGVYLLNTNLLKSMKENIYLSLESEVFPEWVNNRKVFGHVVDIPFIDIGTKERFEKAIFN